MLSTESKKTLAVLINFLKKARLRWTLTIFVSALGLCASLLGPSAQDASREARSILASIEQLFEIEFAQLVQSDKFRASLPNGLIQKINKTKSTLSDLTESLEELGVSNSTLENFTLGPDFDILASALDNFMNASPPIDLMDWDSEHVSNLVDLNKGFQSIAQRQTPVDRSIGLSNGTIIERQTNVLDDLNTIAAFSVELIGNDRTKSLGQQVATNVKILRRDFIELSNKISSMQVGGDVHTIEIQKIMEGWNIATLRSAYERALADTTSSSLKSGSVSAVGLMLPGIVINLILPLLALGLSIDTAFTLRRALVWVKRSMSADDVSSHFVLFPWIPIMMLTWRSPNGLLSKLLIGVAALIHFSPSVLLGIMLFSHSNSSVVTAIATSAVIAIAYTQFICLRMLIRIRSGGEESATYELNLPDSTVDLIKIHLERIDVAWTTLMTVAGTISIFFIAFLFVPSTLLGDRTDILQAKESRTVLESAYKQRLIEHRDTYVSWSNSVRDQFHELTFLTAYLPDEHPAFKIAEAMNEKPPLSTYPSAISNFDDIVEVERASLAQLDLYDLNDLLEILYRKDMGNLELSLNELRKSFINSPLPLNTVISFPEVLQPLLDKNQDKNLLKPTYGAVAIHSPMTARPSVPIPLAYRQEVEKGGFAYRLIALPPREHVEHLIAFMTSKGLSNIDGFDGYTGAIASFDKQLGTLKLKVFGIEVNRQWANKAAPWLIVSLIGLLLLRVVVANRVFTSIADRRSAATLIASTSVSFLHGLKWKTRFGSIITGAMLLAFPCFVLGMVAWSAWFNATQLDWPLSALFAGSILSLLALAERQKLARF